MADTLADRLRRAMAEAGLNQKQLADAVGVKPPSVNGWLSAKAKFLRGENLLRAAKALDVSEAWLAEGRGPMRIESSGVDAEHWADIRGVRQAASLGDGSLPDEYAETHKLKFRAASLRKKGLREPHLVVFYGDGESMEPRIHHGDALLFDTSDKRPVDGQIYLFSSPDTGLTVKRLVDYGGRWFVEADNKTAPNWAKPLPMDGRHPFEIEGRLRWIGSWEG